MKEKSEIIDGLKKIFNGFQMQAILNADSQMKAISDENESMALAHYGAYLAWATAASELGDFIDSLEE